MRAVVQAKSRPNAWLSAGSGNLGQNLVGQQERVWPKAVHRVAAEGIAPEQAVDEAIARIKQLLAE